MSTRRNRISQVNEVVNKSKTAGASMLVYPPNIGSYGMLFMFSEYRYDSDAMSAVASRSNLQFNSNSGSVVLPIPTGGFEERSAISLNEASLGIEGALVAQLGQGVGEFANIDGLLSGISKAAGSGEGLGALAQVARNSALGRAAGVGLASFIPGSAALTGMLSAPGVDKGIDLALGSTANDFKALTFDGVGLRNYSFSWTFYPEKESESALITQITKKFQRAAHPTFDNALGGFAAGGNAGSVISRALLKYPQIVTPYILINEAEKYFMQFKPCLIEAVNVNYRGEAGVAFLEGGKPASVTLSISIKESAIWTAEDYQE